MAQYQSLAALRGALTSDNPDVRGDAYSAVYEVEPDVRPSEVLETDPDEAVLERLAEADVVPAESGRDTVVSAEYHRQVIDLLERIATALEGGA